MIPIFILPVKKILASRRNRLELTLDIWAYRFPDSRAVFRFAIVDPNSVIKQVKIIHLHVHQLGFSAWHLQGKTHKRPKVGCFLFNLSLFPKLFHWILYLEQNTELKSHMGECLVVDF